MIVDGKSSDGKEEHLSRSLASSSGSSENGDVKASGEMEARNRHQSQIPARPRSLNTQVCKDGEGRTLGPSGMFMVSKVDKNKQ